MKPCFFAVMVQSSGTHWFQPLRGFSTLTQLQSIQAKHQTPLLRHMQVSLKTAMKERCSVHIPHLSTPQSQVCQSFKDRCCKSIQPTLSPSYNINQLHLNERQVSRTTKVQAPAAIPDESGQSNVTAQVSRTRGLLPPWT